MSHPVKHDVTGNVQPSLTAANRRRVMNILRISLKFNALSICQSLRGGYNLGYKNNAFLSPFGCSLSA